jgi:hypothetical protein
VMHLANPTATDTTVDVTAVSGSAAGTDSAVQTIDLAAGAAVTVGAEGGATYQLSGFETLRASVTTSVDGGVAAYTVAPRAESSTAIEIYP